MKAKLILALIFLLSGCGGGRSSSETKVKLYDVDKTIKVYNLYDFGKNNKGYAANAPITVSAYYRSSNSLFYRESVLYNGNLFRGKVETKFLIQDDSTPQKSSFNIELNLKESSSQLEVAKQILTIKNDDSVAYVIAVGDSTSKNANIIAKDTIDTTAKADNVAVYVINLMDTSKNAPVGDLFVDGKLVQSQFKKGELSNKIEISKNAYSTLINVHDDTGNAFINTRDCAVGTIINGINNGHHWESNNWLIVFNNHEQSYSSTVGNCYRIPL